MDGWVLLGVAAVLYVADRLWESGRNVRSRLRYYGRLSQLDDDLEDHGE